MTIVAVAALVIWLCSRHHSFTKIAEYHEARIGHNFAGSFNSGYLDDSVPDSPNQAQSDWHELLAKKYRRAARFPWLPVPDDPPMPTAVEFYILPPTGASAGQTAGQ